MIRLSITAAAFDAIAATLPVGSVGFEPQAEREGRADERPNLRAYEKAGKLTPKGSQP